MYNVNDEILVSLQPKSLIEETYKDDITEIINSFHYHSDKISETDIKKAESETRQNIRSKNKIDSDNNYVIRVYDKP